MADESRLTLSERKRRKIDRDARRRLSLINIGSAIDQWQALRDRLKIDNDVLAVTLMEYYENHRHCLKLVASASSTPGRSGRSTSGRTVQIGGYDSDATRSMSSISGIQEIASQGSESCRTDESDDGEADATMMYGDDSQIYEDESDSDEENIRDPNDFTWEPSLENIHLSEDSCLFDDQQEVYPDDLVFDTTFDEGEDQASDNDLDGNEETSELSKTFFGIKKTSDPGEAASADKCMAFISCLEQLANVFVPKICPRRGCKSTVKLTTTKRGTAVEIRWICDNHHTINRWTSQPKLPRGVFAGDFALSACVLLSGNNYKKIMMLLKFLKLGSVNTSTFYKIQSLYCCPVIHRYWNQVLQKNKQKYKGKEIVIAGDGRMDSPGFSAKFCTYTTMNHETLEIISMKTIDKRETDLKSSTMEMKGFRDVLDELKKDGVKVVEVVTDAHPSVSAYMRKNHQTMKHSFDVWHGAKNLAKKLTSISSVKATRPIVPWKKDIINHFWSACQTAGGDVMVLRNKWVGLLHHIIDEHEWALGECDHDDIEQNKDYLKPGSTAHQALTEFVFDDRLMKNLSYYVNYRSTSELECFQNHILMYAGKRFAYSFPVYTARCELAALDYELHRGRTQLLNKDGNPRWHRGYNKNSVRWRAVPVLEEKGYGYITELLTEIFKAKMQDNERHQRRVDVPTHDPRRLSDTIAPVPPPTTATLVQERVSRYPKKEEKQDES